METIIVTRHKALIEWLAREGITGEVIEHASVGDIKNKHVYGVLPFFLAANAKIITEVAMQIPFEFRGKEYTIEQMDEWGAHLEHYIVRTPSDCVCENPYCDLARDGDFRAIRKW